jgi:hypothetical protein
MYVGNLYRGKGRDNSLFFAAACAARAACPAIANFRLSISFSVTSSMSFSKQFFSVPIIFTVFSIVNSVALFFLEK